MRCSARCLTAAQLMRHLISFVGQPHLFQYLLYTLIHPFGSSFQPVAETPKEEVVVRRCGGGQLEVLEHNSSISGGGKALGSASAWDRSKPPHVPFTLLQR